MSIKIEITRKKVMWTVIVAGVLGGTFFLGRVYEAMLMSAF